MSCQCAGQLLTTRAQAAALLVTLILACVTVEAQSLDQFSAPEEIDYRALRLPWSSTNRNPDELASQIEALYLLLYNNGNLPVRSYTIEDESTISEAAFALQIVEGGHFPLGIDSLLCDLNPHVCERERSLVDEELAYDPSIHVGGYSITPGEWWISKGDVVRMVDLELTPKLKFVSRPIPPGTSIRAVLETEAPDCGEYGASCIDVVRKLNPYVESLDKPSDGYLAAIMPVARVSTLIPIKSERVAGQLREAFSLYVDEKTTSDRAVQFAEPGIAGDQEGFDETLMHIEQNLYRKTPDAPTELKINGHFDHLHNGALNLYRMTRHPFRFQQGSINDVTSVSIPVGVIDYWVDTEHCHLAGKITVIGDLPSKEVTRSANCYDEASAVSEIDSHGTHIVGTITGGKDGSQLIGLYPQADLYFSPIHPDVLGDPLATEVAETNILMMSHVRDVRVINISWEYPRIGNNDPILRAIDAFVNTTLFVAAAGNSARDMERGDSGCTWDPSCQSGRRHNVISVVGLTASLDDPKVYGKDSQAHNGSNYGTAFDIGATGQGVLSAVNGNRVARMSGTSQAAPQVTAAAALVMARFKETRPALYNRMPPSPAQLKNRLMYTADIFPTLLASAYSGRLNIERALAINEVQVIFDDHPGTLLHAELVEAPSMLICRVGGEEQRIAWNSVRRIATNKLSNSLVIFYEDNETPNQPQTAVLRRITDCELRTQSNEIHLTDIETNMDVERQLKDIVDFTMRF